MQNQQSISELKKKLREGKLSDVAIKELKSDERKGVQQLVQSFEKQRLKQLALEKSYEEMCTYERRYRSMGKRLIAGIDEAGRGPLAGPVVAAAVILPDNFKLLGLNDSKQLNKSKREEYYQIIVEQAISYGISIVENDVIDDINIYEATKLAMKQALNKLEPKADYVLIDAVELNNLPCSSESIVKGDAKSVSIAAASILAKVTRDSVMRTIHEQYPMYDFQSNMGYGTKVHMEKLKKFGASPYHRKTFAPVKETILS